MQASKANPNWEQLVWLTYPWKIKAPQRKGSWNLWNKGVMLEREDMLTLFNKNKQQLKRGRECVRILLSKETPRRERSSKTSIKSVLKYHKTHNFTVLMLIFKDSPFRISIWEYESKQLFHDTNSHCSEPPAFTSEHKSQTHPFPTFVPL